MSTVRRHRAPRLAAIVGAFTGALIASSLAIAGFSSAPTATHSVSTDRIFPGDRATTAWVVEDAADGTAANVTQNVALADAVYATTGLWSSSWSSSRYVEFKMSNPMAGGLSVTGAELKFTASDSDGAGNTWCFYVEARKTSDSSVLATYGSSGSPLACENDAVLTTFTVSLPVITSSDIANDLSIRIFAAHSGSKAARIDRVNVTGAGYATFALYPKAYVDSATGSATTTPWGPATTADSTYLSAGNWSTAYASTRYVQFTFPSFIPSNATITSASIVNHYRSDTAGANLCYYFEVYAGGSLIGSHGSTGSDISCNASATVNVTDTVSLSEVTTPGIANAIVVKLYGKSSGSKRVQFDLFELRVNYLLGSGSGCASSYYEDVFASADSWVDQGNPTTNNGADIDLDVQSGPSTNKRALIAFPYPAVPSGCTVTARLRLYSKSVQGTRTIETFQANGSWTETGVTWNNQPATTGSAVSFGATPAGTFKTLDVSTIVSNQVSGSNYGFLLKDSAENNGSNQKNDFDSRTSTNVPLLRFAYGTGAVPYASDVQAVNGGAISGRPDSGDTITFTYSQALTASTILAGWNGSSTNVTVRITDNGASDGPLTVWNSGGTAQLPLGSVAIPGGDYVSASGVWAATMSQSGSAIVVTLGSLTSGTAKTDTGAVLWTWTPSTTPQDANLNTVLPWDATESGTSDADF